MNLFHFFMPLVPLALVAALFFRNSIFAYASVILLCAIKAVMTEFSPLYLFTTFALLLSVYLVRKLKSSWGMNIGAVAGYAAASVFIYELASNFGVWFMGGCVPTNNPEYAHNFSGFIQCVQASLPYSAYHFLRDIPISVILIAGLSYVSKMIAARSASPIVKS